MEGLKKYTLAELTIDGKGIYGIGASAIDFDYQKYTYLRITDIKDDGSLDYRGLKSVGDKDANKYLLKKNDIVFARTGNSTGRSYFYETSDGELVYAGFLIKFSLDPNKVNPRILKYYTHSKKYYDWIKSFDTGGTRGNINAQTYANMLIELPSRKVQDKVVDILSSLDDKIALNKRINDNLEQQAQALYKSWFVDFKPFKDGGFIDSELGEIPEGWKILPFVDFLILSNRKTEFDNIPEYSVTNTGIFPREEKFNKKLSSSTSKNKLINRNDLVFGMSREILNWGIMEDDIGGVSSAYTVYNIDYNIINPIYLKLFIQSRIGRFKDLIRPAAREGQGIDKQRLMSKYIYLPTSEILNNFWRVYDKLMESKENFTQETQNLTQVRDSLLPKLMSGELKINDLHS